MSKIRSQYCLLNTGIDCILYPSQKLLSSETVSNVSRPVCDIAPGVDIAFITILGLLLSKALKVIEHLDFLNLLVVVMNIDIVHGQVIGTVALK